MYFDNLKILTCFILLLNILNRVAIHVDGSCSYRVNIRIVLTFTNPNPIRIINVLTFVNPNPINLLFVLDRLTRMTHLI